MVYRPSPLHSKPSMSYEGTMSIIGGEHIRYPPLPLPLPLPRPLPPPLFPPPLARVS